MTPDYEILVRNDSVIADVNQRQRLIDLIAVPWDQEAEVPWHGEMWRESFHRAAFNGIEAHAGRIRVNREHVKGDTVGRAVSLDPSHDDGLLARLKIANTPRGDDTLELAADDMISASLGYYVKSPGDVSLIGAPSPGASSEHSSTISRWWNRLRLMEPVCWLFERNSPGSQRRKSRCLQHRRWMTR